jgi:tetratricopeptide (TPR) repeat protein
MTPKKAVLLLWLLVIVAGSKIDSWHEAQFLPPPSQREAGDVLIDVLGEIKTVLARYLWFRMDLFHEVLDDQGVEATQQTEVLPLLRIITLLDPSMTDSYDQIVWDLYKGHGDVEKALELLEEGLKRNPNSYELTFRKGLIQFLEGQYPECQVTAAKALPLTTDKVQWADCLRLIYWSATKLHNLEVRRRALHDLLQLRPDDPLWKREKEKIEREET